MSLKIFRLVLVSLYPLTQVAQANPPTSPLNCAVVLNGITTNQREVANSLDNLDQVTKSHYQFLFPAPAEGSVVKDFFKIFDLPSLPLPSPLGPNVEPHFQKIFPSEALKIHVVSTHWSNVNLFEGRLDFFQLEEFYQPQNGALARRIRVKQLGLTTPNGKSIILARDSLSNTHIVDIRLAPKKAWTHSNPLELFNRKFKGLKKWREGNPRFRWVRLSDDSHWEMPSLVGKKVAILFRKRSKSGKGLEFLNQPLFVEGTLLKLERKRSNDDGSLPRPEFPFHGFTIQTSDQIQHFGFLDPNPNSLDLIDIMEIRFE